MMQELSTGNMDHFDAHLSATVKDEVERRILHSARKNIIAGGLDAANMTAIARDAGISRPTLYSRYANRMEVLRDLLNVEVTGLVDKAYPLPNTTEELITIIVDIAEYASQNELLDAILQHNSDVLSTYQFERLGRSQKALIRLLRNQIAKLQAQPGSLISQEDSGTLAFFILLITQSFILQSLVINEELPGDTWRQQLTRILEGYLY